MRQFFAIMGILGWLATTSSVPMVLGAAEAPSGCDCCCSAESCGCCAPVAGRDGDQNSQRDSISLGALACVCASGEVPTPPAAPSPGPVQLDSARKCFSSIVPDPDRPVRWYRVDDFLPAHGAPAPPPPGRAPPTS